MTDEKLYEDWAEYMEETLPDWDAHKTRWDEGIGWYAAPPLRGLVDGYRYSGDARWLKYLTTQIDDLMERLKVEDGHPGWGHSITGEALLLEPILNFVHVAQTDDAMPAEYKARADEYLGIIDPAMICKWDEMGRWHNTHMGCGTYTEGISLPHNKNAHLGMMLIPAAHVTPSAERRANYLDKVTRLARRWRKFLKVRDDHYIWHYWDPAGRWDYNEKGQLNHWVGLEHRGYGSSDTAFMAAAYDHGLVFSRQDVEMHCRTFLTEIWNGDTENPQYRALGWFNPEYVNATVFTGLVRFSEQMLDLLAKAVRARLRDLYGMAAAPLYLLVKKRADGFRRTNADWTRKALGGQSQPEMPVAGEDGLVVA